MGKKGKKQRKRKRKVEKIEVPSIKKITKANWKFMVFFTLLSFLIYFNSLDNQLTLVDDIQAIVFNEKIKDLPTYLREMNLLKSIQATSYRFFGYDPLPIRINSVVMHLLTTILVFYFTYIVWGKKISQIATLVFATHPINTEAVTWISGSPYLYYGFFMFLIFNLYVLYYAKKENKYLAAALIVYVIEMVGMRSPWVLVPPLALIVLDQLILEKKFDISRLWWVALFAVPISIYLLVYFGGAMEARIAARSAGGTRITMHTQALKPVTQGYPYSTYLMSKLYVFPKTLTVYYDGMEVTTGLLLSMYITFIAYAAVTIFLLKKHRQIAGILIMLPILIAPAYSPIKITWFLSERYLYSGTAFVGVLFGMGTLYLKNKINSKYISYGLLGVILVLFSIRTVLRNDDWQDTESLSYANIEAAPLSVRAYNDMGGHFYYQGDVKKAVEWYEKGLEVVPTSGTAINNLGFIYFELGPLIFWEDVQLPDVDEEIAKELYGYGLQVMDEGGEPRTVSYFLNKSLLFNPYDVDVILHTAEMYKSLGMPNHAARLFEYALSLYPDNTYAQEALNELTGR